MCGLWWFGWVACESRSLCMGSQAPNQRHGMCLVVPNPILHQPHLIRILMKIFITICIELLISYKAYLSIHIDFLFFTRQLGADYKGAVPQSWFHFFSTIFLNFMWLNYWIHKNFISKKKKKTLYLLRILFGHAHLPNMALNYLNYPPLE